MEVDEEDEYYMFELYTPVFFNPPLHIFPIPSRCPAAVAKELSSAFRLYWCDPASCVNHQRIAIELLLDKMNVRRFSVKNGNRSRISLHHRIEHLPENTESQREIKESLLAIKFIGNEGSHAGYISKEDALDGFELLEQLVDEEARERQREMRKRRKQIIKQKGPRGKAEAVRHSRLVNKLRKNCLVQHVPILRLTSEPLVRGVGQGPGRVERPGQGPQAGHLQAARGKA